MNTEIIKTARTIALIGRYRKNHEQIDKVINLVAKGLEDGRIEILDNDYNRMSWCYIGSFNFSLINRRVQDYCRAKTFAEILADVTISILDFLNSPYEEDRCAGNTMVNMLKGAN